MAKKKRPKVIQNFHGSVGSAPGNINKADVTIHVNKSAGKQDLHEKEELNPNRRGFSSVDFLSWIQNWQIIFYLVTAAIGIGLLYLYPSVFPDGLPNLSTPSHNSESFSDK